MEAIRVNRITRGNTMTEYPITELCKLSKELDHERMDSIAINLERILLQEEGGSDDE